MHWTVEIELADGTWYVLAHCSTADHAASIAGYLMRPEVATPRTVRIQRWPLPLPVMRTD